MDSQAGELTRLLQAWSAGDRSALERLLARVYPELHRLAHRHMNGERRGDDVLQTTALIHEAYVRLIDQRGVPWKNRAQFFAIASRVMRRVLVDAARRRRANKRGAGAPPLSLDSIAAVTKQTNADVVAIHEALQRLEQLDERKGRIVEMRFFGGLSVEETAEVMAISPATVKREFAAAKAWLYRELGGARA
jgi:RNA polymerase sigma factor (TIGR02999 family)